MFRTSFIRDNQRKSSREITSILTAFLFFCVAISWSNVKLAIFCTCYLKDVNGDCHFFFIFANLETAGTWSTASFPVTLYPDYLVHYYIHGDGQRTDFRWNQPLTVWRLLFSAVFYSVQVKSISKKRQSIKIEEETKHRNRRRGNKASTSKKEETIPKKEETTRE